MVTNSVRYEIITLTSKVTRKVTRTIRDTSKSNMYLIDMYSNKTTKIAYKITSISRPSLQQNILTYKSPDDPNI